MTTTQFDPQAWVAAYEAAGGNVQLMRQHGRHEGLWLGVTLARNGRSQRLHREFSAPDGREEREAALTGYLAGARGVLDIPDALQSR